MTDTSRSAPSPAHPANVLLITDHITPTAAVLAAIRHRVDEGPVKLRVLLPNPAAAEVHLRHPERHDKVVEAERLLQNVLPDYEAAAGAPVVASVSIRHDPYDAVEELMLKEPVDEFMVWAGWHDGHHHLHADLAKRLGHLGRPLTARPASPTATV